MVAALQAHSLMNLSVSGTKEQPEAEPEPGLREISPNVRASQRHVVLMKTPEVWRRTFTPTGVPLVPLGTPCGMLFLI